VTDLVDQTVKLPTQSGEIVVRLLGRRMARMIWSQARRLLVNTLLLGNNAAQDREPIVAAEGMAIFSNRSGAEQILPL
jgi:hypothetical protein